MFIHSAGKNIFKWKSAMEIEELLLQTSNGVLQKLQIQGRLGFSEQQEIWL